MASEMQELVDRATRRLYERYGSRIVLIGLAGGLGYGFATALAWVPTGNRYYGASAEEGWFFVGLAMMAVVVLFAVVVVWSRQEIRQIVAWSDSERDVETAERTWVALTTEPRKIVTRAAVIAVAALWAAAFVLTMPLLDVPLWFLLIGQIFAMFGPAGFWILSVFSFDLLTRPMLEDVARNLPHDFAPPRRDWSLTAKAVAPLPVVTMIAAVSVGAYADLSSDRETRGVIVLAIATAVVALAGIIYLIAARSVLAPLESLTGATRRVRSGDLDVTVPVVSGDDLGELTASFNQMVMGLRERDALRSSNERLASDLRDSLARVAAASDAARRKVERDLHDGAQQHLVLVRMKLGLLERDPAQPELLAEVRADLNSALEELRDLAHGIYPAILESDGLPGALSDAATRASIATHVDCDGTGRYAPEIEAAVYFCCLEALQNASKHAGPGASAAIRLRPEPGTLRFAVSDDGPGFDASGAVGGGLQNMADRIGALGGRLEVESARGKGTTVAGSVPVPV